MSNPELQPKTRRLFPFATGAGCGCLIGFVLGVAALSLLGLAYMIMEEESAANPLADLKVPEGKLTAEQFQGLVDHLAGEYLKSTDNVGLVIATIREDKSSVTVSGYGTTSRGSSNRPDGDTVFEIASVGKTFTGVLLAEMAQQNEVRLIDPLSQFLPKNAPVPQYQNRQITLLDLATHSSGLPSLPPNFASKDPLNPYKDYTTEQMLVGLGQIELERSPGSQYEYSNLGFGILGYALAQRAGQDFEQLIAERLLSPLGMTSTRMTLDAEYKKRLATPHADGQAVPVWEDTTMPGAGSFLSTANDLIRFIEAQWNMPLELPATLRSGLAMAQQKYRPGGATHESLGLGWHISSENALTIVWHNGASGGSCSYVAFLPQQRAGVVVLSNSTSSVDEIGHKLMYLLAWH
jgi:D-alanyl-D-alanine-carboxypeptidase/D-alanyl-D-alanine-endopeptidase